MNKITCETNVDHYCNVNRQWRIDSLDKEGKKLNYTDPNFTFLIVNSGTDGISIATKSSNNGFFHLTPTEVKKLILELKNSIPFSKEASFTMTSYWAAKNGCHSLLQSIKNKFR